MVPAAPLHLLPPTLVKARDLTPKLLRGFPWAVLEGVRARSRQQLPCCTFRGCPAHWGHGVDTGTKGTCAHTRQPDCTQTAAACSPCLCSYCRLAIKQGSAVSLPSAQGSAHKLEQMTAALVLNTGHLQVRNPSRLLRNLPCSALDPVP